MAATTAVFTKLNPRQIELVAEQRQLHGAHAYYTETYDINRVPLSIHLPGYFKANSVFTAVYEYTRPHTSKAEGDSFKLSLAEAGQDLRKEHVSVSGAYTFTYVFNSKIAYVSHHENRISTPKQGLHVLQFRLDEQSLVAFLDGVQIAEKGKVVGRAKNLNTFFAENTGNQPFKIWETHYTTPKPRNDFNRLMGFGHAGFKLRYGSYVQFSGSWTNKPKISEGNTVLGELDITGNALPTISVYINHSRVTNGLDYNLGNVVPKKVEINLGHLHCTPPTQLDDITIVVGDYGK